MLQYARSDTHFLLFIYDHLRNALLDRSASRAQSRAQTPSSVTEHSTNRGSTPQEDVKTALVREVLSRSEDTALRVCERDRYDSENGSGPGGWDTLARKWNKGALTASENVTEKARIYRAVHAWRDRVARDEDESTGYVTYILHLASTLIVRTRYILPNRNLFILAEQPPTDMASLLSKFHHVNPVLRRRSKELLDTIRQAAQEQNPRVIPEETAATEASQDAMQIDSTPREISPTTPTETPSARLWPQGTCDMFFASRCAPFTQRFPT